MCSKYLITVQGAKLSAFNSTLVSWELVQTIWLRRISIGFRFNVSSEIIIIIMFIKIHTNLYCALNAAQ